MAESQIEVQVIASQSQVESKSEIEQTSPTWEWVAGLKPTSLVFHNIGNIL